MWQRVALIEHDRRSGCVIRWMERGGGLVGRVGAISDGTRRGLGPGRLSLGGELA